MKKLLCLLLASLMMASAFTGCGSSDDSATTTQNTDSAATTTEESPEEKGPEDAKYDSITIGDTPLSEFTIVYAKDEYGAKKTRNPEKFEVGETAYAQLTAKDLQTTLKNMTGIKLPIVSTSTAATEHEILVGGTTRSQSIAAEKGLGTLEYSITMSEGKLCLLGGSSAANYHALENLYKYFASQNSSNVTIPSDYSEKGEADVITVSCVGDSITDGYSCSDYDICPWPNVLQRILWKDYVVSNFGVSGTTMRTDHRDAYINCWKYPSMIEAAPDADITLIMLGTNDSDRFKTWTDADTEKYKTDYTAFLDNLTKLNPDVKFIMMNCPEYYGGNGSDGEFGSNKMLQIQKELFDAYKAEGRPVSFFDMHSFTRIDMGSAMFPDNLYPGDAGYAVMAQRLSEMLEAYRNGTDDKYLTM